MMELDLGDRVRFTRTLSRRWEPGALKRWAPYAYPGQREPAPRRGIIIGVRTLSNGHNEGGAGWDDPLVYVPEEHFVAYLIAFDKRRRPVLCLPEHITEGWGQE